jgi:geranylgeranyl diphosphate synthase type II
LQNPGKRLRPFLVLAFSQLYNNNKSKPYNAALAVELLHNFSLVHDDIMDNSDTRRGHMTLHVKYDLSVAILAGDNLLALAYEYLLKDCKGNRGIEAAKKVYSMFDRNMRRTKLR